MEFAQNLMKRVDEAIKLTASPLDILHPHVSTQKGQDDSMQHELWKQYGLAIQTPQHGTISTILSAEAVLLINGFVRRYLKMYQNKICGDKLVGILSSIVSKYYIGDKLKIMSNMNDLEGTGCFASENNCMFVLTSMLLNRLQLKKSTNKSINIYIESKHSTSLYVSFGIIGIKRKCHDQLLHYIYEHFQSSNDVGSSSGWFKLMHGMKKELNLAKDETERNHVELFGYKTAYFLLFKNQMTNQEVRGLSKLEYVNQGDKILIQIKNRDYIAIYSNDTKIFESFCLDTSQYLYFPFIGDTYNNNFEFDVSVTS